MADDLKAARNEAVDLASDATKAAGAKLADVIDRVGDRVKDGNSPDLGREAKGLASDLKSAALESGRHFVDDARERATGFADRRKDDAAQSISDIASSLRETGGSFEDRPNIQAFMGSAADGLEQLATGLKDRSFAELYQEAESYARRSPVTVGLVAVAAGFLLARFIKASADDLSEPIEPVRTRARVARTDID